jgi:hypothetical protein
MNMNIIMNLNMDMDMNINMDINMDASPDIVVDMGTCVGVDYFCVCVHVRICPRVRVHIYVHV